MASAALDILVIDHEPWASDVLVPTLRRYGHDVRIAGNEAEALRQFADRRPQVTLVELPADDPSSVGIIRQLRRQDAKASIIGLTGTEQSQDLTPARDAGITEFLTKAAFGSVRTDLRPRACVLIVDDEPTIAALLARFLSSRGYEAQGVCSGLDALQSVADRRPDAILLDLFMPGMNGLELLRELRARNYHGAVVALSAAHDDVLLRRLMECGPVHVVGKPVDLDRLGLALQVALALTPASGQ